MLNCGTSESNHNNTIIYASFKDDGSKINYRPAQILTTQACQYLFNCFKFKKT